MLEHLSEAVVDLAQAGITERLRGVHEDRWVDHPRAESLLDVLNATLHPSARSASRCADVSCSSVETRA